MWSRNQRCGLRAQDELPTEPIILEPDQSAGPPMTPVGERRAEPVKRGPTPTAHEEKRWRGKAIEYASIVVAGAACAVVRTGWWPQRSSGLW